MQTCTLHYPNFLSYRLYGTPHDASACVMQSSATRNAYLVLNIGCNANMMRQKTQMEKKCILPPYYDPDIDLLFHAPKLVVHIVIYIIVTIWLP